MQPVEIVVVIVIVLFAIWLFSSSRRVDEWSDGWFMPWSSPGALGRWLVLGALVVAGLVVWSNHH
ncbi:MAG TPA: hypothetical protein VF137_05540 [Candidatus Dormibacteraeota bacterium]